MVASAGASCPLFSLSTNRHVRAFNSQMVGAAARIPLRAYVLSLLGRSTPRAVPRLPHQARYWTTAPYRDSEGDPARFMSFYALTKTKTPYDGTHYSPSVNRIKARRLLSTIGGGTPLSALIGASSADGGQALAFRGQTSRAGLRFGLGAGSEPSQRARRKHSAAFLRNGAIPGGLDLPILAETRVD